VQHHHQANYHHHYHQGFHHQRVPQDKGVAKVINASCGVNQLGPWARFACVAQQKPKKTSSFSFPFWFLGQKQQKTCAIKIKQTAKGLLTSKAAR